MSTDPQFDVIVVGGGPAGATAAGDLAAKGHSVLMLDQAGRIKPCGGAIPPRLIRDFDIPQSLLCARISGARMVAPSGRKVDMPIDDGYVGMVDREHFDEWLRCRAVDLGAERRAGKFQRIERSGTRAVVHYIDKQTGEPAASSARIVVGADGARSAVARQEIAGAGTMRCVFAYHEIVEAPDAAADYRANRCDVYYQGVHSPDFYAWVFPHGRTASIGVGSAHKGFSLRGAVAGLRTQAGLDRTETLRHEGAPIPLKPLKRWDNGRDVIVVGDAAGCVAPASGEGIYYAMTSARLAAEAVHESLATGDARALATARRHFMKTHGRVFLVLGIMQSVWYRNDRLRERFVKICEDEDVQRLTWQSYMNKELVRREPLAHVRIFFKDMAHLLGLATP